MNKIIITTDSGLNPIEKTTMIPGLIIDDEGKEFYDQKSLDDQIEAITMEKIFAGLKEGRIYQTSAPKMYDYYKSFRNLLEKGYDILHLSVSEYVSSSSYNISMNMVEELSKEFPGRIQGVHTKTAGSGGTILSSYANNLLKEKLSLIELKEKIEVLRKKVVGSHFISSAKGYIRSGRVPKSLSVTDFLGLKYRVDSNFEGKLVPKKIYRGKTNIQAMKYIKELVNENNIEEYDSSFLALLHMPLREINYEKIIEYLKSFEYFKNIIESPFSSTIASYGVEDQLGLGLIKK